MRINGISATIVFEASAVNRDEKLARNITSIKKFCRDDGNYSFMSRAFVRHHLFETLQVRYNWEPAPVALAEGQSGQSVIQFRFPEANIVTHPEMDIFGFMNTSVLDSDVGITRKAPLGITKAVSLEPWQGDMAFYANHDMVQRAVAAGLQATPNPFQKEEHYSYYRVSFTIDLCRLGIQEIYIKNIPTALNAWIEKLPEILPATFDEFNEFKKVYGDKVRDNAKWKKIETASSYGLLSVLAENQTNKMVFLVHPEERKKRIAELISVFTNGLMMHSSTENYGIVPSFFVIGTLAVPVPIFNNYVKVKNKTVDAEILNNVLRNNGYIQRVWYNAGSLALSGELESIAEAWRSVDDVLGAI